MKNEIESMGSVPFVLARRKTVTISPDDLVTFDYFDSARKLPLVIRPRNTSIDLIGWAKVNLPLIESELRLHGAILFRGFAVKRVEQFQQFVNTVSGRAIPYSERTSPRTKVTENVYTSTDYPSDQAIVPHNENSYAITFPRKLYFWCETPAQQGGQTPIGDTRRILAGINEAVLKRFLEKGWMYVRNFTPNLSLSWQTAFQTDEPAVVEDYCRKAAIEWEWTTEGLRTRQVRPAAARHPETGEAVWFNHAMFFHISSVEPSLRARLMAEYDHKDVPNNTYYGDGSPIEDSVIEHLRHAYDNEMVSFLWEASDLLLIDNMLAAHARAPFVGPRRILVAMAEPYTRTDLAGRFSEV